MTAIRPLVAGNWKMNGLSASLAELEAMRAKAAAAPPACDLAICPPATLLAQAAAILAPAIAVGGQDCSDLPPGAHTGDLAAAQLRDAGATFVILGHSERRADHRETDALVLAKARAAAAAGLAPIVCVGETRAEREAGRALAVVGAQVAASLAADLDPGKLVVAYEPVWAIGTGLTPTLADVAEMHVHIRAGLVETFGAKGAGVRILYGGSVKPQNARELLGAAEVGGALVGGASLKAADFFGIAAAYA